MHLVRNTKKTRNEPTFNLNNHGFSIDLEASRVHCQKTCCHIGFANAALNTRSRALISSNHQANLYGKETLELEEVSNALLDHYQRKQKNSAESSGDELVVKGYQDRGRKKEGNDKFAKGRSKSKSKTVKCYKCQKKGHFKQDCLEWKKEKEESSKSVNIVAADLGSDGDMLSVSSSMDVLNNS